MARMTQKEHIEKCLAIANGEWSNLNSFMDVSEDRAWAIATSRAADAAEALIHMIGAMAQEAKKQMDDDDQPF